MKYTASVYFTHTSATPSSLAIDPAGVNNV
jgi:hypothetical protein